MRGAVAEKIAALDIVSNGRVEFGNGRSITKDELLGFGIDPGRQPGDAGRGPRDDPAHVHPGHVLVEGPVLRPARAAGDATTDPEAASADVDRGNPARELEGGRRARLGDPVVRVQPTRACWRRTSPSTTRRSRRRQPVSGAVNNRQIAVVADDVLRRDRPGGARDGVAAHPVLRAAERRVHLAVEGQHARAPTTTTRRWLRSPTPGELFALPTFDPVDMPGLSEEAALLGGQVQNGLFCVGSPATCVEFVQKHVDAGIDQLIFPMQFGTLRTSRSPVGRASSPTR